MVKGTMTRRRITLSTAILGACALALFMTAATTSVAQPPPTTANTFRMFNSASPANWIEITAQSGVGTGTFSWPAPAAGIFKSDASGTMSIGTIDENDLEFALNALLLGGGPGNPATELLSPGPAGEGQVLQINASGVPTWSTINELPNGGPGNSTLFWNPSTSEWESTDQVQINPTTGTTTIGDNSTDANIINGSIQANDVSTTAGPLTNENVMIIDPAGNVTQTSPSNIVNAADLTEHHLWVGDVNDNPSELPVSTEVGAVLQQNASGAPFWSNDLNVDNITVNGDQINNGDVTFNGPNFTTSSSTTSTFNGPTNISGPTTNIDGNTINIGNTIGPSTTTFDGTVIFNTLPNLPLQQHYLFVGNSSNVAAPFANGTNGQVLQIDASGAPVWQDVNELPTGTVDNSILRWDDGSGMWVENTNVLANAGGDVDILGDFSNNGNTELGNDAGDQATINAGDVEMPNIPTTPGPLTTENVLITDGAGNVTETSPDNIVGAATLLEDYIYVGNANDNPAGVAPGTNNQVLQINGTTPTWQSINLLPTGTVDNSTLVWDLTLGEWIENTLVTMDPLTGDVNLTNGDLQTTGDVYANDITAVGDAILGNGAGDEVVINDQAPTLPNLNTTTSPAVNDDDILVIDPTTNEVTRASPDDVFGNTTLNENAIFVGDVNDNPGELASSNNEGDVLTLNASGTPVWSTPAGGIESYGTVTGNGADWQYTVSPSGGIPAGSVIMIQLTSTTGLNVTNVISNITPGAAGSFTVDFPVVLSPNETFHWVVID